MRSKAISRRLALDFTMGKMYNNAEIKLKAGDKYMSEVKIISHPLVAHKLTMMRDKNTSSKDFRELLNEIAMLMGYEVTSDLPTQDVEIETPLCKTTAKMLANKAPVIVPILRAGLGMTDGLLKLIPNARVGHIGLYRDPETHLPVPYYCKLPDDAASRLVLLIDPMIATGGSILAALRFLREYGCHNIRLVGLLAAPEGIEVIQKEFPDVDIYLAALDSHLNDHVYIVPGLGDAGDRIFGTK